MNNQITDIIDIAIQNYNPKPSVQLEMALLSNYEKDESEEVASLSGEQAFDYFFESLTLKEISKGTDYWEGIKVKNDLDYFKRWVFAFASIHTSWENNVRGYNFLINDLSWTVSKERLKQMLDESRLGLNSMRFKALWEFTKKFRSNPKQFYKKRNETWVDLRDRLTKNLFGIGQAKVSFALNLAWPVEAKVCCLDVHLLRFLGWEKKEVPSLKKYKEMEQKWLDKCDEYNLGYGVVRELYWNKVQKKPDSRYWSYCLED